jgi:hypothetical protein
MTRYTATMDALWQRRVASASGELDAITVVRLVLSTVVQVLVESRSLAAANSAPTAAQGAAPSVSAQSVTAPVPVPVPVPVQASPRSAAQAGEEDVSASRSRVPRFTAAEDALIVRRMGEFRSGLFPGTKLGSIRWSVIDKELGRSMGAAKQRWVRVLGPLEGTGSGVNADLYM